MTDQGSAKWRESRFINREPELISDRHERFGHSDAGYQPPSLLSHEEARLAGEAMFERAHTMAPELRLALTREDAGWADMLRAGWEAVWAARRAAGGGGENGEGPKG